MKSITSSYTNNFDFIRLVAALFVLVTHSYQLSAYFHTKSELLEQVTEHYLTLSYLGVGIFFIISGYLISQSLYRSVSTFDYLKKRVVRIFPGLVTVVFLSIIVLGPLVTTRRLPDYFADFETFTYLKNCLLFRSQTQLPGVFLTNPVGPQVNGSLWTLVYEFSFYLLLLFCYQTGFLRLRFLNLVLFLTGLAALPFLKQLPIYYNYYPSVNMSPGDLIRFLLFFWSGVLAFLYKDRVQYTGFGAFVAAIGCVGLMAFRQYTLFYSLLYILWPYLLFYLAYLPGSLNRFGKWGDFSYGIYIYSFPIQQLIVALYPTISGFILMGSAALGVAPLAWMSWFWIESPALRWAKLRPSNRIQEAGKIIH